ncbi:RHS repeat domain-containing protein [Usitatibacter palustris]|uniref:RHS repeat-associated core domain-containing protein n=1 Tax=Usitatibacter palustris TaxID=2732487 RepID=A0A6M4H2Q1_9PROT|nr:RHS repeat-associated core domain-containing protein [Usitatibacter palustris]QJR13841.1 hypothetical protein DSM104440_00631 [Usitatibacter palustris]
MQQRFDRNAEIYNYFRDYDPRIGRYVESDPIGLKGGINTYGYVDSNAIGFFDDQGLTKNKPKYIWTGCSDSQLLWCVENCRAQGKVVQDCTQTYVRMPGVNGGKPRYIGHNCVCEEKPTPALLSCGPTCRNTLLAVGAIVVMICTRFPIPVP